MLNRFKGTWKVFTGALAVVGGLASLTFAATGSEGKSWVQWGAQLIGIAVLTAAAYFFWPYVVEMAKRIHDYPKLKTIIENTYSDLEDARAKVDGIPERLRAEREAGRQDVVGIYVALMSGAGLTIRAVSTSTGVLTVLADLVGGNLPVPGARFLARTNGFGVPRGALEVVQAVDDSRVHLVVAQIFDGNEEYWRIIEENANQSEVPPGDLELVIDTNSIEFLETWRNG